MKNTVTETRGFVGVIDRIQETQAQTATLIARLIGLLEELDSAVEKLEQEVARH